MVSFRGKIEPHGEGAGKMSAFMFSFNAVSPIVIMVAIGYLIKRMGILNEGVAKVINRVVFRLLLPCSLFLNIYSMEDIASVDFKYIYFAVGAIVLIFLCIIPASKLASKQTDQRAAIIQGAFRSNHALIGIPLATALYGDAGAAITALLSAFVIPLFNILAVICFTTFGTEEKPSIKKIFVENVKNPLNQSVFLGLVCLGVRGLLRRSGIDFRLSDVTPMYSVISQLAKTATPMALLALGAQFEFSVVAALKKQIIFGTGIRVLVVPAVFLSIAYGMGCFNGAHFAAFVSLFATPVAVSSVPMAQEFGADSRLAGQLVVWTTLVSSVSIFFFCYLLKAIGAFA